MIYLSYNFTFTVFMICIGRYLTYTNLLQLAKIYPDDIVYSETCTNQVS
ncbi:hypothetical protein FOXYSP1_01720 [Fusarium oxysporum f. sp. phaseoli]